MLIDSGSTVNIFSWNAYQKIRLKWADLLLTTSPLYGFTRESVIPEGTIKLAITIVIDFLVINCPPTFNGVLGRPLLRILKAVISIHCLTMKFPTITRMGQV